MQFICGFCQKKYTNQTSHFSSGQCTLTDQFSSCTDKKVIFKTGRHACKRCMNLFNSKQLYEKHTKNCKRDSIKAKSSIVQSKSQSFIPHGTIAQQKQAEVIVKVKRNNEYSINQVTQDCYKYLLAIEKPYRKTWLKKNVGFDPLTLFNFYKKFLDQCFQRLSSYIPEVQLTSLPKLRKVQWSRLIKHPHQIFDKVLIESRMSIFTEQQIVNIKKALNKFYEPYPIQKFVINKIKKKIQTPTQKDILLPFQFIKVLQALTETQIFGFVHFAVDLMIIYQSGLRFPSSYEGITSSIRDFRLLRKKKGKLPGFQMTSTKTQISHRVIFDQQLMELIQILDWRRFIFPKKVYERLSSFLPFSFIMMRRGYISYLYIKSNSAMQKTSLLSQHKSWKNAQIYVEKIINQKMLQYKQNLRIPNLKTSSKMQAMSYLEQISIPDRVRLSDNWFPKAYTFIKSLLKDQLQSKIDILEAKTQFTPPEPVQIDLNQQKKDPQQQDSSPEAQLAEQVTIYNMKFALVNGKFQYQDLFVNCSSECSFCQQQGRYQCVFCRNVFCILCKAEISLCFCCKTVQGTSNFIVHTQIESELQLKMPQMYFNSTSLQDFDQIKFLIFARGYNFVNCPISHPSITIPQYKLKIAQISLPQYHKYESFQYFPPIYIKSFGDASLDGTGFGLFARQNIEKNVFIGQYAADMFNSLSLKFCRRKDMIFHLYAHKNAAISVDIGPIQHCGYIGLINDLDKKNNCKSVIGVVNNKLKILIYTYKKISRNQQLGLSYCRTEEDINQQNENEQVQCQDKYQNEVRIKNNHYNCYLNVILQLLRHFRSIFCNPNSQNKLFLQINKFYGRKVFNPNKLCQYLHDNTVFKINREHDAHQLFLYIANQFNLSGVNLQKIEVVYQKLLKCTSCQRQWKVVQKQFGIFVDDCNSILNPQQSEMIDDFKCQVCKGTGVHSKSEYTKIGQILIVTLKRFSFSMGKDNSQKEIPIQMFKKGRKFNLIYIINHIGESMENGHYTFIDIQNRIEINDFYIADKVGFSKEEAYMVVYKKELNEYDEE